MIGWVEADFIAVGGLETISPGLSIRYEFRAHLAIQLDVAPGEMGRRRRSRVVRPLLRTLTFGQRLTGMALHEREREQEREQPASGRDREAFPGHEGGPASGGGGHLSKVLIQVSDTGSGMSLDTQTHMFEPFFSTKEMNVRLGLTAVYGIVKQSAGQVDVVRRPGEGTVVRVALPLASQGRPHAPSIQPHVSAKGQETVLLVGPNEIDRKLALSTPVRHRYRVLEAHSSIEALLLAQQHSGTIQVAVSDLIMPEIGGRDLARRLLQQHPMMKPLFVSGYNDEAMASHRLNPRYLLRRPYRQARLLEKVRELLDS